MVGVPSYTKVDSVEVTHYDLHEYGWMLGEVWETIFPFPDF